MITKEKRKFLKSEAASLRAEGLSYEKIGKTLGISEATAYRYVTTFVGKKRANQIKEVGMDKRNKVYKKVAEMQSSQLLSASDTKEEETLSERVARLERELEDAKLRADAYSTMIDIAEEKFSIQIRKKAGAKQ